MLYFRFNTSCMQYALNIELWYFWQFGGLNIFLGFEVLQSCSWFLCVYVNLTVKVCSPAEWINYLWRVMCAAALVNFLFSVTLLCLCMGNRIFVIFHLYGVASHVTAGLYNLIYKHLTKAWSIARITQNIYLQNFAY